MRLTPGRRAREWHWDQRRAKLTSEWRKRATMVAAARRIGGMIRERYEKWWIGAFRGMLEFAELKMMRRRLRLKSYYELGDYYGQVGEALVIKLQDQFWCWDSHHYTRVRLKGEATLVIIRCTTHSLIMRASLSRSSKYYRLVLMNVMPCNDWE